ncbi:MAG: hypothetical protein CSA05_02990 [Bacteroidia bacterium]|nr:MAG: hypothetical protein CSA05_02990 [Bacteroidia bacterium]
MKKLIILAIGYCLITSYVFAQNLLTQSDVKEQKFGKLILYKDNSNNLLNGHYRISDTRGNFIDVHFNDGKKNGTQTDYDYKERKLCEKSFKNGKTHGKYQRYHQNGKLSVEGEFVNGLQEGKWKYYDDKGELKVREFYKAGKADGKWWAKGKSTNNAIVYITENYKNGEHHGRSEQKNDDGKIDWEREYTNDGSYRHRGYYPNGKL